MAISHKIKLPEGYTKELRQAVKQNKSNAWLYKLLNDIYQAGYVQAVTDYTQKINQEIANAISGANSCDDNDGKQLQSDSSVVGTGERTSSDDANRDQGSPEPEPVASQES